MEPSWAEQRAQPCWYWEHPHTGSSGGKWARTQLLHSHPCQLPPAPLTATCWPWGVLLSVTRSLFNLPEVYLEDTGRCRKIFSEGEKKSEQRPFAAQEKKLKEMLQLQLCQTASGFSLLTLFKQTNSQHLETEAAHVKGKKKIRHTSKDTELLTDLTCV